jgi:hypothetical protein
MLTAPPATTAETRIITRVLGDLDSSRCPMTLAVRSLYGASQGAARVAAWNTRQSRSVVATTIVVCFDVHGLAGDRGHPVRAAPRGAQR